MARPLLSSKVTWEEQEPRVRAVQAAATSVLGLVGVAQRGPIGEPVLCTSPSEYQAVFGDFTPEADMTLAAMGFYENGGTQLWAVRTVHYGNPNDPATATATRAAGTLVSGGPAPASVVGATSAPFALRHGDLLRLSINGAADVDVVFRGGPAFVETPGGGPFALADGMTLTLRVGDADQTVTFRSADFVNIAAATVAEVVAVLNPALVGARAFAQGVLLRITTTTEGTASRLQVTGGTANTVLRFPTTAWAGTGNVADLRAVDLPEVDAAVRTAIPTLRVEAGPTRNLLLRMAASAAEQTLQVRPGTASAFGLDQQVHAGSASGSAATLRVEGRDPGAYGNQLELEVRAATNGSAAAFDLLVLDDGVYRETFTNLTMVPGDDRYVLKVVNDEARGSHLVRVVDLEAPGGPLPAIQTRTLSGGTDGLTGLMDADFVGSEPGQTGIYALDRVLDLSLLAVPGRATPAVHDAMITYCEVIRHGAVFAILDPPAGQTAQAIVTYVSQTASLEGRSEYAAIYWPRVRIRNPARSIFGSLGQIVVAPSGIIAGVFSRNDASRGGVYQPPAGVERGVLQGVLGFETDEVLREAKRDLVFPHRINPLTTAPRRPRYIDGSRTLKGNGLFSFVAQRRGVIFIERSLEEGLQFARHQSNTEALRAQVQRTVTAFLLQQMKDGAFASKEPKKAFYVDLSDNGPTVVAAGRLNVDIGLALAEPAEFIVLRITKDTRALESSLET